MRRRRIRWLLTPLIWLKNILDHEWWADFIGELHKASRTHKGQAERLEKILKVIQNVDKKKKD